MQPQRAAILQILDELEMPEAIRIKLETEITLRLQLKGQR
jgi:hypothetical protein